MNEIVVRRSAMRMWVISVASIPLIVLAVDVLTQRRITNSLRDLIFRPDDTQLFEFRDVVWAWVILIAAGAVALWALRELIVPSKVIFANRDGLRINVTAPLARPLLLGWSNIDDIGSATVEDEGDVFPVLWIRLIDPDVELDQPWSGRWMDDRTLAMMASDWDTDPIAVARQLAEMAIDVLAVDEHGVPSVVESIEAGPDPR